VFNNIWLIDFWRTFLYYQNYILYSQKK